MIAPVPLVVFSDLDGTLLDHDTYSWAAARPAIAALAEIGAVLVLASSKTAPEIEALQQQMGVQGQPAIVENGAGLIGMGEQATADCPALRQAIEDVPDRALFEGFGDMDALGVAAATGLDPQAAVLARKRSFSEPGVWHGTPQQEAAFISALAARGIAARRGGRFLTLSFGRTKADGMADIMAHIGPAPTMALGDAPNDTEMLEAAENGVIIHNPHSAPLPRLAGEATGRIIRTLDAGPIGWNQAVLARVELLNCSKD
ncbi:MAG: HAD hydrolase family protein [Sulfitobacter sp.]